MKSKLLLYSAYGFTARLMLKKLQAALSQIDSLSRKVVVQFAEKILLCVIFFSLLSPFCFGMQHTLPVMQWSLTPQKAQFALHNRSAWRSQNSYGAHKSEIEQAMFLHTKNLAKETTARFSHWDEKENINEFFAPINEESALKNHYALIKDCICPHCPLNRWRFAAELRSQFEDEFLEKLIARFPDTTAAISYIGFGSNFNFLSDLRIILQLKKRGYRFNKLQFIDPVFALLFEFISNKGKEHSVFDPISWMPVLKEVRKNSNQLNPIIKTITLTQVLALLSLYDDDNIIELYTNAEAFVSDPENNGATNPCIITALDLIDAGKANDAETKANILHDFRRVTTHKPDAPFGFIYVDAYKYSDDSSPFGGHVLFTIVSSLKDDPIQVTYDY